MSAAKALEAVRRQLVELQLVSAVELEPKFRRLDELLAVAFDELVNPAGESAANAGASERSVPGSPRLALVPKLEPCPKCGAGSDRLEPPVQRADHLCGRCGWFFTGGRS